jgi:hypothetical protein
MSRSDVHAGRALGGRQPGGRPGGCGPVRWVEGAGGADFRWTRSRRSPSISRRIGDSLAHPGGGHPSGPVIPVAMEYQEGLV